MQGGFFGVLDWTGIPVGLGPTTVSHGHGGYRGAGRRTWALLAYLMAQQAGRQAPGKYRSATLEKLAKDRAAREEFEQRRRGVLQGMAVVFSEL